MKVLMFGWEFPPLNSGGLGTACYGITKSLSNIGVEISFVLPKNSGITESFINIISTKLPKIKIKEIDSLLSSYITSQAYEKRFLLLNKYSKNKTDIKRNYCGGLIGEVYRYSLMAKEIAADVDYDVIHVHDWMTFPSGIEAKKISKKPLLVHVHSTETDRSGGHSINPEVFKIEKGGVEKADKIIAVSQFTKSQILRNYNVSQDKVSVVYNAIDKSEFSTNNQDEDYPDFNNKKIVLFLGRITLHKGPDYFIKAAKKVLDHRDDVIFVVSGSGDMENQVVEQAADLGIADKVLFTGFLRDEKLKKIYKMAALYVMPSVSEPFGITPLESLACKTPVIVSNQSGVSEILHHCLKVDFWDVDEMANKIISVLDNEELKECLADNGFLEIDKFRWDNAADKIIRVYNQLVGERRYT